MTLPSASPPVVEVSNAGWDERVRIFRAGGEVDTAVVITQSAVVLIDTMSTPAMAEEIMAFVEPTLSGRELLVVNTHADWDHAWGNALFRTRYRVPIIGHALTAQDLRADETQTYLAGRQAAEPRFAGVNLTPPTISFTESLTIDGGDLSLVLMAMPGHTPDHCVVWVPEIRVLFAGDAAEQPIPSLEHGNLAVFRASLDRMAALDPLMIIPCHGGTTDPGLLARNRAYLDEIERRAQAVTLPSDWASREDLPDLIHFSFDEAVRFVGSDPATTTDFYRGCHLSAVRATLAALTV